MVDGCQQALRKWQGEIFESASMRQQNVFGTVRDLLGDASDHFDGYDSAHGTTGDRLLAEGRFMA
jgi:hypothetical protein